MTLNFFTTETLHLHPPFGRVLDAVQVSHGDSSKEILSVSVSQWLDLQN